MGVLDINIALLQFDEICNIDNNDDDGFQYHDVICSYSGIVFDKSKDVVITLEATLEPELLDMVSSLLNDKNAQVRIAAAITLYTLKKPSDKVSTPTSVVERGKLFYLL